MTATIVEIDESVLDALDFEHDEECESTFPCGNQSTWVCTQTCCKITYLICDYCKEELVASMKRISWNCTDCGARDVSLEWKPKA